MTPSLKPQDVPKILICPGFQVTTEKIVAHRASFSVYLDLFSIWDLTVTKTSTNESGRLVKLPIFEEKKQCDNYSDDPTLPTAQYKVNYTHAIDVTSTATN